MANLITFSRLIFLFVVFLLLDYGGLKGHFWAIFLTVFLIVLDAVDGLVARLMNETSEFGSVFDIIVDRIVENCFWIYFASRGIISVWIPFVVISRGFLTDGIRSVALSKGMTAFGEKSLQSSWMGNVFVNSRISRGLYGFSKILSFLFLIVIHGFATSNLGFLIGEDAINGVKITGYAIVYFTIAFCILRAIPVYLDSRIFFINKKSYADQQRR